MPLETPTGLNDNKSIVAYYLNRADKTAAYCRAMGYTPGPKWGHAAAPSTTTPPARSRRGPSNVISLEEAVARLARRAEEVVAEHEAACACPSPAPPTPPPVPYTEAFHGSATPPKDP